MWRLGFGAMFAMIAPLAIAQTSRPKTQAAPALPYFDWKACPFEGCSYREWTARKPVEVYDTWKQDRRVIARLASGEKVTGVSGVVITFRPGVIRMDRDLAELDLKRGDEILTYTYQGEGVSSVWFKGRFDPDFDISFAKWPDGQGCGGAHCAATYVDLGEKVWWAKVRLGSGTIGWVNMENSEFDGVDMLARRTTLPLLLAANTSVPQFGDFPSATGFKGPAISPRLAGSDRQFRTQLLSAGKEPPNFAGHYRFAIWGCGSECVSGAVIDLATGEVIHPPQAGSGRPDFSICRSAYEGSGVEFHVESRLAIVRCGLNFDKRLNRNLPDLYYFVLEDQAFKEILRLRGREALARSR
jgi:hypothetical protein